MISQELIQDMNEVNNDFKKLDKNGQIIAMSIVACLLARQKMDEEGKKVV